MSNWVVNRLITCCLDNAAVLEAAGAVAAESGTAEKLRALAGDNAARAHELAVLLHRLGGRPVFMGTARATARCRSIAQAAPLGDAGVPGVMATALRSVGDALATCESLHPLALPPLVRAAIEIVYADLRLERLELNRLLGTLRRMPPSSRKRAAAP